MGLRPPDVGEISHATQSVEEHDVPSDNFSEPEVSDSSLPSAARSIAGPAERVEALARVEYPNDWVTTPWIVISRVDKEDGHVKQRISFTEWRSVLELVLGVSKQPARRLRITEWAFLEL